MYHTHHADLPSEIYRPCASSAILDVALQTNLAKFLAKLIDSIAHHCPLPYPCDAFGLKPSISNFTGHCAG